MRARSVLKRTLFALLAANVVLGLALLYVILLHAPYFSMKTLDLIGNHQLSRAEVVETAGIETGVNLITVDLGAITSRLKKHPWIRSASAYRRFPSKLVIEIQEKIPSAILAAGNLYYVDERGEVFTKVQPGRRVNYPLLTGVSPAQLQADISEVREMIREGLNLLDIMDREVSDLTPAMVAEVRIDVEQGLMLQMNCGRLIVLGKGKYQAKLERYVKLKRLLTRRGEWSNAGTIDLDFEDRAVVRWGAPRVQG